MRFGIVVFPGSNCDHDCYYALETILGQDVEFVWHKDHDLNHYDCVILPGGFSYGDYLRAGAIAQFSPVMTRVRRFAEDGGMVLGICNGFQMLLEMRLLPGAMHTNRGLTFVCRSVLVRIERTDLPFTCRCEPGQVLRIPVAHFDGNYYADPATLAELQASNQVVCRYCNEAGQVNQASNPNGSVDNVAALCNRWGNVFGIMPHPERACEALLGSEDGRLIFQSLIASRARASGVQTP